MVVLDDRYMSAPTVSAPTGPPPYSAGDSMPVATLTLDALSNEAIAAYRDELRTQNPDHPWLDLPCEEFLVRLNAAYRLPDTLRIVPTKAGLLMFGHEHEIATIFPGYVLDYRKESDAGATECRIVSNDGHWSGCVFDFWARVSQLLVAHAADATSRARGGSLTVRDASSMSPTMQDATREGLANALAHADYGGRRHVVIIQRPDRIEYANPGRLRIRSGTVFEGGTVDPRNPTLMKMFALIGVCKNAGTGLPLIRQAMRRAGFPDPIIVQYADPDRTILTLPVTDRGHPLRDGPPASPDATYPRSDARSEEGNSSPSTLEAHCAIETDSVAYPVGSVHAVHSDRSEIASSAPYDDLFASMHAHGTAASYASAQGVHHAASPRDQLGEDDAAVNAAISRAPDEDCRSVLELFRTQRRIKRSDVEDILGIGSTKAKSIVAALISNGLITAEGGGRSTYYKLARS